MWVVASHTWVLLGHCLFLSWLQSLSIYVHHMMCFCHQLVQILSILVLSQNNPGSYLEYSQGPICNQLWKRYGSWTMLRWSFSGEKTGQSPDCLRKSLRSQSWLFDKLLTVKRVIGELECKRWIPSLWSFWSQLMVNHLIITLSLESYPVSRLGLGNPLTTWSLDSPQWGSCTWGGQASCVGGEAAQWRVPKFLEVISLVRFSFLCKKSNVWVENPD